MIAFGFSNNFYAAIALRFIWGVADGYLGICKTVLSEICSEDMLPITTGLMFISAALSRLFFVYFFIIVSSVQLLVDIYPILKPFFQV